MNLCGSMCAIVTPFRYGKVDQAAFAALIEDQIANGTSAIVPCGTTGESATLTHDEHHLVIDLAIKYVNKRVPVIAGTGSNSTAEAISLTRHAKQAGADAVLLITPYYNKPTQEGLYAHYMAIADAVEIPQLVYNVPGRTGVSIAPETVARLAQHPNIVGIKEASGSTDYVSKLASLCDITILSGNDSMTLPLMALGAKGVISVVANVAPKHMSELVTAALEGHWVPARQLHYELFELMDVLFCETNPIPVKAALAMMGVISPEIRLPLTPLSEKNVPKVRTALEKLGLVRS
ncbi:MAG: 4-hydroxy-tetrahydrodipicolinate synthase [Candidatus Sumerlaeaceae bacterium]|jgi:4-hydroxy-tetrahydrodipicolinate synthase